MKKPLFFTIISMLVLYFLWWLSGVNIIGFKQENAPIDRLAIFFVDNFQTGMATIFEAISSIFAR